MAAVFLLCHSKVFFNKPSLRVLITHKCDHLGGGEGERTESCGVMYWPRNQLPGDEFQRLFAKICDPDSEILSAFFRSPRL